MKLDYVYTQHKYGRHKVERRIYLRPDDEGNPIASVEITIDGWETLVFMENQGELEGIGPLAKVYKYLDACDARADQYISSALPG